MGKRVTHDDTVRFIEALTELSNKFGIFISSEFDLIEAPHKPGCHYVCASDVEIIFDDEDGHAYYVDGGGEEYE